MRRWLGLVLAGLLAAGLLAGGCAARRPMAAFDVTEGGWLVEEVHVTWRPGRRSFPEEGTLLVANHPDGRQLVQFIQQWTPVLTAQWAPAGWLFNFPGAGVLREGEGRPPTDLLWFWIDPAWPEGGEPEEWQVTDLPRGGWRMEHRVTGEMLELRP